MAVVATVIAGSIPVARSIPVAGSIPVARTVSIVSVAGRVTVVSLAWTTRVALLRLTVALVRRAPRRRRLWVVSERKIVPRGREADVGATAVRITTKLVPLIHVSMWTCNTTGGRTHCMEMSLMTNRKPSPFPPRAMARWLSVCSAVVFRQVLVADAVRARCVQKGTCKKGARRVRGKQEKCFDVEEGLGRGRRVKGHVTRNAAQRVLELSRVTSKTCRDCHSEKHVFAGRSSFICNCTRVDPVLAQIKSAAAREAEPGRCERT